MAIRFVCKNTQEITVPRSALGGMLLFQKHPELAKKGTYQLRCNADLALVNSFLSIVYTDDPVVNIREIPEETLAGLKTLSKELGYSKFDAAVRAFEGETGEPSGSDRLITPEPRVDDFESERENAIASAKERDDHLEFLIEQLTKQIQMHEQLCQDLQRRLSELDGEKMKADNEWRESVSRQIKDLERKVEEVARGCEQRDKECAKRSDIDTLARVVEQLRQSEKDIRPRAETVAPTTSGPNLADRGPISSPKLATPVQKPHRSSTWNMSTWGSETYGSSWGKSRGNSWYSGTSRPAWGCQTSGPGWTCQTSGPGWSCQTSGPGWSCQTSGPGWGCQTSRPGW